VSATALTSEERAAVLARAPAFARVPADGRALLAEMMTVEAVEASRPLFHAGDPAGGLFVVARGTLAVHLAGAAPGAPPLQLLGPGEVVGEYGLFSGLRRTATVVAVEDAVLLALDYERFQNLLLEEPTVTLALLETTVRRLVELEAARPPGSAPGAGK
jgi:CRP-like cAMP-binding protein